MVEDRSRPKISVRLNPTAFQFLYMVLAIDIIDGHGLTNKVRRGNALRSCLFHSKRRV